MNLTEVEIVELRQQANGRSVRADLARRARLILLLAEGLTWSAIRAKLDCNDSYIALWSKRFAADRLAGLFFSPGRSPALQGPRPPWGACVGAHDQAQARRWLHALVHAQARCRTWWRHLAHDRGAHL